MQLIQALILAATVSGAPVGAQLFANPEPKVFARPEDQTRARLLRKPCTEADEGRGCHRFDGRLFRDPPCTYHIEEGVLGSLPVDQCFKMEPPRRYRGVWIDEFESQRFIPEGTPAPEWPDGDLKSSEWRKQAGRAIAATIWLDVERAKLGHKWQQGGRRVFLEFVGRKTLYPGNYGHMGMSGQAIIVDTVISQRECAPIAPCR